jgi:hypothetical protein
MVLKHAIEMLNIFISDLEYKTQKRKDEVHERPDLSAICIEIYSCCFRCC